MAAHVPIPPGLPQTQNPGTRVFIGNDECALKHATVLAQLSSCLHTCYGPAGSQKLLITRLGQTILSSSARTILPELEIEHPAGILVRQACETQLQECGDGTNAVLLLAAALMSEAAVLLRGGVTGPYLCNGYRLACAQACQKLESLSFTPWNTATDENNDLHHDTAVNFPTSSMLSDSVPMYYPMPSATASEIMASCQSKAKSICHPMPSVGIARLVSAHSEGNPLTSTVFQLNPKFDGNLQYCALAAASSATMASNLPKDSSLHHLVAWACIAAGGEPETVRVHGYIGGSLEDSWVLLGAVLPLEPLGVQRRATRSKLALYMCPFGEQKTRVAGTTLIQQAEEFVELGIGRERVEEARVSMLSYAGITVLAVAGAVSELALHYCNKAGILVVRLERRSQARELELATGARGLTTDQRAPQEEEIGQCQRVYPYEIGGNPVLVFEPAPGGGGNLVTVVIRGATSELLGAAEQLVKGAVQCYRALREEPRMVVGAGAVEIDLSLYLEEFGHRHPGLEHHGLLAFSRALDLLPRTLARNWGLDEVMVFGELRARHCVGEVDTGIFEDGVAKTGVMDPFIVKKRVLELATDVAVTLLGCGQVVVAKKSGGPRFRKDNPNFDLEPDLID
ncbi:T-complex protein 1 subunit theta-like [Discoglossus pictus]